MGQDASVPFKIGTLEPSQFSQLQHNVPSALVAEAIEQILPQYISCQDPASKSRTQFLESPDQLLVLTLSVTDLC